MDEETLAITPTEARLLLIALERYRVTVEGLIAIGLRPNFKERILDGTLQKLHEFVDRMDTTT